MTTQLVLLERALEQLAQDFATKLIEETLHTRIADLGPLLEERLVAVGAVMKEAPRQAEPAHAPAMRAKRRRSRARPVVRRPDPPIASAQVTEGDDVDMITDPSLLLGVIAADSSSMRERGPSSRDESSRRSCARDGLVAVSVGDPTMRPGEELQRSSGGNVVLRRGRK